MGRGGSDLIELPEHASDLTLLDRSLDSPLPPLSEAELEMVGSEVQGQIDELLTARMEESQNYINAVADDLYHGQFHLEEQLNALLALPCYQTLLAESGLSADDARAAFWTTPDGALAVISRLARERYGREDIADRFQQIDRCREDGRIGDLEAKLSRDLDAFHHALASEEADEWERVGDDRAAAVEQLCRERGASGIRSEELLGELRSLYLDSSGSSALDRTREQQLLGRLFAI